MKTYIETYGCSHNYADSEAIKQKIIQEGHEITNKIDNATIIIINTCAVKNKTISNLKRRLKYLNKTHPSKKIILAGCLTQASIKTDFSEIPEAKNYLMIGTNSIEQIGETLKQNKTIINIKKNNPHLYQTGNPIHIIPISTGCLNNCTYCQTKLARGKLQSYLPEEIIKNIKDNIAKGTIIFYLTSQDNGCYGFDINTNLHALLSKIRKLENYFILRIGMGNPQHLKNILPNLLETMQDKRIFKFLHIPLQSGSDEVLKHMRRGNTAEDFTDIIKKARKAIPDITIATDIIVGYPTETKAAFNETIKILNEVQPDVINRAKFSPRPGTEAEKLKPIQTNEVTKRSKLLDETVKKISAKKIKKLKGAKVWAIAEKPEKNTTLFRTINYKPVIIDGNYPIGTQKYIYIEKTETFHAKGKII